MSLSHEIDTLIRARYPILYLLTAEEMRAQDLFADIALQQQKQMFEWSVTTGMVPAGAHIQSRQRQHPATKDPLAALDLALDHVTPALFLFKDFHPFLNKNNPAAIRRLKEISLHLKNSYKTIVLISPVLEIPIELEKEITVLNLPPPNLEELSRLLDNIDGQLPAGASPKIELDGPGRERVLQAALGLTWAEAENVFAKILVEDGQLCARHVANVLYEKRQCIRKNGLLEYYDAGETFSEIGGLELLKEWLRKRAQAFSLEARGFGLAPPRGILLLGVQGCGKSLCAKAVAAQWQLPLLRFDIGRMFGSYVGSSEENIRKAISLAESIAPDVFWVDEIDKAFAGAQSSGISDSGTSARVFGAFLTWLSEKTAPVFVVATANDISHLPPELLRKGRLDEIFFVDLPSALERRQIFAIHLRKKRRDPDQFALEPLVEASADFSGSEIEEAIQSALYDAFSQNADLTAAHLQSALAETIPLARTMREQISELRRWAAGRARPASLSA